MWRFFPPSLNFYIILLLKLKIFKYEKCENAKRNKLMSFVWPTTEKQTKNTDIIEIIKIGTDEMGGREKNV